MLLLQPVCSYETNCSEFKLDTFNAHNATCFYCMLSFSHRVLHPPQCWFCIFICMQNHCSMSVTHTSKLKHSLPRYFHKPTADLTSFECFFFFN